MSECDAVVTKHTALVAEKTELQGVLSGGAASVQDIINKTERLKEQKNNLEKQVSDVQKHVKAEEELIEYWPVRHEGDF